jgi:hypothetical protein
LEEISASDGHGHNTLEMLMAPFLAVAKTRVERKQDLANMMESLAELEVRVSHRLTRQLTANVVV